MKQHLFIAANIALLVFISSCVTVKSTFPEQYSTKIKLKPDQQIYIQSDDEAIYTVSGAGSVAVNGQSNTRISKISTARGTTEWIEGVSDLGEMSRAAKNIVFLEDLDIAIVFGSGSRSGMSISVGILPESENYMICAIDLKEKRALWSYRESSPNYSYGGIYLDKNESFIIQTPEGLRSYEVKSGNVLWEVNGLSSRLNVGRFSLMLKDASDVDFLYLESLDRIMIDVKGNVSLLNPYTGKFDWQVEEKIGSYLDADIFENQQLAVFYGRDLSRENQDAADALNTRGNTGTTVVGRIGRGASKGVQRRPLIMVDLSSGEILWRNEFYTNGQNQLLLTPERLLITGVVAYTFNPRTGEKLWQNVTEERLQRENLLGVFAEFSGIDLTADRQRINEAVVIDNSVFVIYPELFEQGGNVNQLSIRLYDYVTGEMLWKTAPERMEVRDMYFRSGLLFLIVNGRFSQGGKIIAIDPYTGEKLYEIDSRQSFLTNLVYTDDLILSVNLKGELSTYNIRTGDLIPQNRIGLYVIDLVDLGDKLMVVYSAGKSATIAYHDRNNFALLDQLQVPFYSRNMFTVDDKLFMVSESSQFKGIMHLDLEKMEVKGYITISTTTSTSSNNPNDRGVLGPYQFVLTNDPTSIYLIQKKKLIKYSII